MAITCLDIPIERIRRFAGQPRTHFAKAALQELADSINAVGQIVPAVVRKLNGESHDYELIDGERRWRACKLAGKTTLRAVIDDGDRKDQFRKSIAANFGRQEHTPLEIAAAIRVLSNDGMTQAEIAPIFGKSPFWVGRFARLTNLCPEVQEMLSPEVPEDKRLTQSAAIALADLPPRLQIKVAKEAVRRGLGVFDVNRLVRQKAKQHGVELTTREIKPSKDAEVLMNWINTSRRGLERFTEMRRDRLREVLASVSPSHRAGIVERLESLSGDLMVFAEMLGEDSRRMGAGKRHIDTAVAGARR